MSDFVMRVLRATAMSPNDLCESILWRTDDTYAPVTFLVKCNDLFHWGSADCEAVTPENVGALERAIEDARAAVDGGEAYGPLLFCARVRGMRPQGAYYDGSGFPVEMFPLFDACGPERAIGGGNTVRPSMGTGGGL